MDKLLKKDLVLYNIVQIVALIIFAIYHIFINRSSSIAEMLILAIILFLSFIISYKLHTVEFCLGYRNCQNVYREKHRSLKALIKLSKESRHDYMNTFQIIYGYLQLRKNDRALEQIAKATEMTRHISRLYTLSTPYLSLLLDKKIRDAYNYGLKVSTKVESKVIEEMRWVRNSEEMIRKMDSLFSYIINCLKKGNNENILVIEILEEQNSLEIVLKGEDIRLVEQEIHNRFEEVTLMEKDLKVTIALDTITFSEAEESLTQSTL